MTMDTAEAIRRATEWVEIFASRNPEFRGAHLMGGVISMPKASPFPATSDLDLSILVDKDGHEGLPIDELYRGVPIEAGLRSVKLYSSAEIVLGNPDLASNLAADSILADPYGLLGRIQPGVSAGYRHRRWVSARCEWEKQQALAAIGRAAQASTAGEFLAEIFLVLVFLSGLITVASLQAPTHRKCLVLLRGLLETEGRSDLYERLLAVAGLARLHPRDVVALGERGAAVFDRAVEVYRTPNPFGFKLHPHLRPYLIDGIRLMVDEGNHREASPWICLGLKITAEVIRNDAPAEAAESDRFWSECCELLDIVTPQSRLEKVQMAIAVKDSFFAMADAIVDRLPDDMPMAAATA